jgi:hypothetical protein
MARYRISSDGALVEATQEKAVNRSELFSEPKQLGDGAYRFMDGEWIPLDGANGIDPTNRAEGVQIIKDIEPYRPVASDVAHDGKRPVIGGRRQHREFLKRNGYTEVGNSFVPNKREQMSRAERIADIKRAIGE